MQEYLGLVSRRKPTRSEWFIRLEIFRNIFKNIVHGILLTHLSWLNLRGLNQRKIDKLLRFDYRKITENYKTWMYEFLAQAKSQGALTDTQQRMLINNHQQHPIYTLTNDGRACKMSYVGFCSSRAHNSLSIQLKTCSANGMPYIVWLYYIYAILYTHTSTCRAGRFVWYMLWLAMRAVHSISRFAWSRTCSSRSVCARWNGVLLCMCVMMMELTYVFVFA